MQKKKEMSRGLISFFGCAAADLVLFAAVHICYGRFPKLSNKSKKIYNYSCN
mgnify:FL=1